MMLEEQIQFDLHASQDAMPKHERLKEHLLSELRTGRLRPGDALPREVDLAAQLKVARNTLRQALGQLDSDGFIRRIRGKGTFVADPRDIAQTQRKVGTFALVAPEVKDGYYPAFLDGFECATSRNHYQSVICSSRSNLDVQARIILQLIDQSVQGVAMVPVQEPTPAYHVRQLQKQGIPLVFCHRRPAGVRAPGILLPFSEIGRRAAKALLQFGHRRIGFFTSVVQPAQSAKKTPERSPFEQGVREEMQQCGAMLHEQHVFRFPIRGCLQDVQDEERAVVEILARWYSQPNPPTGIIASFDTLAALICFQLRKMGLRVPEDVSVVGFGGTLRENIAVRKLSSVTVDAGDTGRRAVELLWEMHSGERPIDDDEMIMTPLDWAEGQTIAPPSNEQVVLRDNGLTEKIFGAVPRLLRG